MELALDFFYAIGKALRFKARTALQKSPVEARAWIVFSPHRDVLVPRDMLNWIFQSDGRQQGAEGVILGWLKLLAFQPFQFNSDRKIVAVFPSSM